MGRPPSLSKLGINEVLTKEQFKKLSQLTVAIATDLRRKVDPSVKARIRQLLKEYDEKRVLTVSLNEEELHYSAISGSGGPAIILM